MVQETKRFLAYICPHCLQSVIVERDLFSLAAAPAHIKCPCGKSELLVEFLPNRVRLRVPCLFCGREHQVSCSSHAFLRERALAFSCAQSGLDCCYVGEEGPVYAATARLEQAVDKLGQEPAKDGALPGRRHSGHPLYRGGVLRPGGRGQQRCPGGGGAHPQPPAGEQRGGLPLLPAGGGYGRRTPEQRPGPRLGTWGMNQRCHKFTVRF